MQVNWSRLAGGASVVGGVLTLLVSVPPTWYGLTPTDSYVFSAPMFSPLWINRTVVPVLAVLASLGLLAGLVGLVRRDWSVAGRARRWGGVLSVIALSLITVSVPTVVSLGGEAGTDVFTSLIFLLVGLLGAVLLGVGLLIMGYGYSKTRRPRIGYAFVAVVVGAPVLSYIGPNSLSAIPGSLLIALAWVLVGLDLWRDPSPLGAADSS